MSEPKPNPSPKRPSETPVGDPPRRTPDPVDGPVDNRGGGADPDYLPGDTRQPEDLPKR